MQAYKQSNLLQKRKTSISNHYKRKYRRVFKRRTGFVLTLYNTPTQTATQGGFFISIRWTNGTIKFKLQRLKSNTAQ